MARVVFDTVVFVRALINPFSFCGRVVFDHHQDYRLVLSRALIQEIAEVIHRRELTSKFASLPGLDVRRTLELLAQAEIVEFGELPQVSRDPKDDKFLATAKEAGAGYLVSQDEDLLVLSEYEGTKIVDCTSFLRLLEQGRVRD